MAGKSTPPESGPTPHAEKSAWTDRDSHGTGGGTLSPGPDVILGLWSSWVDWASRQGAGMQANAASRGWWQAPSDQNLGRPAAGRSAPADRHAGEGPDLRAIEDGLNVNPLHDVIPVDWAEIVRALRSIWLLKMSRPGKAMADAAEFSHRAWQSALDTWNEAGQRWLGMAGSEASPAAKGADEDKRFAAPEWQATRPTAC